jgi:hypothetical protein
MRTAGQLYKMKDHSIPLHPRLISIPVTETNYAASQILQSKTPGINQPFKLEAFLLEWPDGKGLDCRRK